MRSPVLLLSLAVIVLSAAAPARADESAAPLARQARTIRDKYCSRCHGPESAAKGGFGYVLDRRQLVAGKLIVPGDADSSELLDRIREGSMPPEDVRLRPAPVEIAVLEKWIRSGAPADESATAVRPFRGERDVLAAIRTHLRDKTEADRPYQRYFTLTNLHNSTDVSEQDLRLYRSALAKLVNSLSRNGDLVVPQALGPDDIVFAVDLRRLGWDKKDRWQELLQRYPYGLLHQDSGDAELRTLAREVAQLTDPQCDLPYVRADWFVAELGKKDVRDSGGLAEPIALLVRRYQRELGTEDVACELGLRDAKTLQDRLKSNEKLQTRGLKPSASGATITRQTWEARGGRTRTLFQEAAFELGLGTPYCP